MCGICGILAFGPSADPVQQPVLREMADSLRHRGPDDDGYYVSPDHRMGFGFRRLSIVDLATGDQPMFNEDNSISLVFNGEIYNHADLRPGLEAKGHRFRSRCDAEVILHLYEEYGPDCIHHLRGMFAFAVWDERRRRLLLARDRIGVKPLYFVAFPDVLLFGSEIKALFRHPRVQPRLDEEALSLYLTFAATPAPRTLFQGVEKLPPGHRLIVDADTGERRLERYWQPLPDSSEMNRRRDPEEYVERLEALIRESIGLRMMSDVPYGAFLSGGVDSSLNVALMAELADRPVSTFSVAIEGDSASDELAFARAVAQRYGTQHHEVVIGEQDFLDYLPDLVFHQDEPLADPVCVPLHAISEEARRSGTKVIQVGEGADELFVGYSGYAFFSDFYERVWRPYRMLPALVRRAMARSVAPFMRLDRADVVERAARDGELFWGGAIPFYDSHKRLLLAAERHGAGARLDAAAMEGSAVEGALKGGALVDGAAPDAAAPDPAALDAAAVEGAAVDGAAVDGAAPDAAALDGAAVDAAAVEGAALDAGRRAVAALYADVDAALPHARQLDRMIGIELRQRLPELLLMRVDKVTMGSSLEARVPYLDHKLVEFALAIPADVKYRNGVTKWVLKRVAERAGLDTSLVYRSKRGFCGSASNMLSPRLLDRAEQDILDSSFARDRFNVGFVRRMFAEQRAGRVDHNFRLWTLWNLVAWHACWLERSPAPPEPALA